MPLVGSKGETLLGAADCCKKNKKAQMMQQTAEIIIFNSNLN
jgi:hypothetical protein